MRNHRLALTVVAAICLLAALIHGLWMRYLPHYPALANLDRVQMDFVQLLNAAITLFLFMMGIAAWLVARDSTLSRRHVRGFMLFVLVFWAARFALEVLMPLRIPLLFIDDPGIFAKVVMALPVVILALSLWFGKSSVGRGDEQLG